MLCFSYREVPAFFLPLLCVRVFLCLRLVSFRLRFVLFCRRGRFVVVLSSFSSLFRLLSSSFRLSVAFVSSLFRLRFVVVAVSWSFSWSFRGRFLCGVCVVSCGTNCGSLLRWRKSQSLCCFEPFVIDIVEGLSE